MIKLLKCGANLCSRNYCSKVAKEMKYLNVAEKNDAAKTIAGLLSSGTARRREGRSVYNKIYEFETLVKGSNSKMVMTSVSGHLMEYSFLMSYRNWNNVDPQSLFDAPLRKTCKEDFLAIKQTLEREVRSCQGLIIWTDCDREGENIGFEIINVCQAVKPTLTVYRAIFSEITSAAVRRALQNLSKPDKRSNDAVDVRSELDLRTGAAITRFQTMRLQRLFPEKIADKLISYGSCQIPTLGFVAERYKEIEAFVSEPFWKIKVTHTIDDLTVEFLWARNRLFDKQTCEDYFLLCLADPKATVEKVTVKPKSKWRPTPLDTVEMEKLGSRKLKISAKEVMTIAEKLYSKGIISYPRTETNQFSKDINLRSLVEQQAAHTTWGSFAQRVLEWGPNPRNGNKSDQAHPPIHPTKLVTDLQGNDARVYELICRHFLACVSKDAVGSETVVEINIAGEKFTATGLCIYERNYLDVYIYDRWNAKQVHKYEQGQIFEPTEITMPEGATTAPALLTEADLIALMEKHGIGTDATHAEHISTIKERGYIGMIEKGFLVPGVIGMGLYEGYDAMQLALAKPVLRAEFEADLKKICLGEKNPQIVLREQIQKYKEAYKQIMERITNMDEKIAQRLNERPATSNVNSSNATNDNPNSAGNASNRLQELFQCPKCSMAPLALRQKKNQNGHFIGCMNFPDCKNVIWLPDEWKEPSVLDETCPSCGSSVKLLKFKFTSSYYKALFNAPNGWYKTCLRCNTQLLNNFNINMDSVKRLGAIVSDVSAPSSSSSSSGASTISSTAPPTNTFGSTSPRGSSNTNNAKSKNKPKTSTKTTAGTSTRGRKNQNSNIRSFFTAARSNAAPPVNNQASEMNVFFDSNDSFENALLTITETESVATSTPPSSTNATNINRDADSTAAVQAAFDAYVDDDDEFADFVWGSQMRQNTHTNQNHSNPRTGETTLNRGGTNSNSSQLRNASSSSRNILNEQNVSALFEQDNDFENYAWGTAVPDPRRNDSETTRPAAKRVCLNNRDSEASTSEVKCSGCHQTAKELIVRKEGPNKGRKFYVCPKPNQCKFFSWADELQQTNHTEVNLPTRRATSNNPGISSSSNTASRVPPSRNDGVINCNCGTPALSLTVRKEGINKGRSFYSCPRRDDGCKFFQWADENADEGADDRRSKKRKCGLCRQEGHTKLKCPRKAEFEY